MPVRALISLVKSSKVSNSRHLFKLIILKKLCLKQSCGSLDEIFLLDLKLDVHL